MADRLTEEQQRMVKEHMYLVELTARELAFRLKRHLGFEELVQIGAEAMTASALTFDPLAGWKFATYAGHRVRGSMYNEYGKLASDDERVHALVRKAAHDFQATQARQGDVLTDMDGGAGERMWGHMDGLAGSMFAAAIGALSPGTPEQAVSMHESFRRGQEALGRALARLPERDARLLRMRYFEGCPLKDVGVAMKIRPPGVYRQHDRVVKRLRRLLEAMGVKELPPREDEL